MAARAALAFVALAVAARAQSTWVEVLPTEIPEETNPEEPTPEEIEKRYTPELVSELKSARDDALLLYTEYSARAGAELKIFLMNVAGLTNEIVRELPTSVLESTPETCRTLFEMQLKKIEYDTHRAASFSAENHHKFLLGHMIVFRMHLNKSEDYIRKCDKLMKGCGIFCENTPRVTRWRRLAAEEIHRVRDDMQHSRRFYRDLVLHAHRKLTSLRRKATARTQEAIEQLKVCAQG